MRRQQLQIRVTAKEKAKIRAASKQAGMDMSEWVLLRLFPPGQQRFAALMGRLRIVGEDKEPFVLAEVNDFLTQATAEELEAALAAKPDLSPLLANYVAAMCEMACAAKLAPLPSWLDDVPPLVEPYFAEAFLSLRPHLLTRSPIPFRRRNLFVDASLGDRV